MEDQECSGKKSKRFKEMKEGEVPGTMMRPTRCDSVTSIVSPRRQRERKLDEFGREEMKGAVRGPVGPVSVNLRCSSAPRRMILFLWSVARRGVREIEGRV
jgi:hypothetical protein